MSRVHGLEEVARMAGVKPMQIAGACVLAVAVALAACAAGPPVSPSGDATPSVPAAHSAIASPSAEPAIVACDSAVGFTPPPLLTCAMAVEAGRKRLGAESLPVRIEFHYGWYCPPGQRCPATRPEVGYVVFDFSDSPSVMVEINLVDRGDAVTAVAGTPESFPPP